MITKCYIKVKSFNSKNIEGLSKELLEEINKVEFLSASIISLPKKRNKITLLKSPHVHKKSREQFEIKKYSRLLSFKGPINLLKDFVDEKIKLNKKSFYYTIKWKN